VGGREEGGAGPFDEGDQRDRPERGPVEQDRRGEAADREDPDAIGRDHQPLAVVAVGRSTGGQCEQGNRERAGEGDDAGLRRRLGHREHE
jgi:hypothetical protein